ncbi:MAG: carboxylate-amine ligase [Pseudolabrys sp.]|nr:carboxylate-amine ligase [Pseudolabrys sp.]MBV9955125.1 carboxylate-amine ligase [Pseudolabrys sp.]
MSEQTAYSVGMEEEYFVFDRRTRKAVGKLDAKFLADAKKALGDRVMTEMLQSQIEVVTPVCTSMAQARAYLAEYRTTLATAAARRKLGIAACGSFPLAFLSEQTLTPAARYDKILDDLQMIAMRNMLCGMHVHVGVPDVSTRINLIMRLTPYLPLLLALSSSSPFWQGNATGLHAYRLAAYDELPRTGLPELFRTNEEYREYITALAAANIIPDESYIWWAVRPSKNYPTVELRVADSVTRLDDAIAIAALFRCLVRGLDRNREVNAGFDRVARAITAENKWRAQRHGIEATFVEPMRRAPITAKDWLEETFAFVREDAAALQCEREIAHLHRIISVGTSADAQIAAFEKARKKGKGLTALKPVVDWLAQETANV